MIPSLSDLMDEYFKPTQRKWWQFWCTPKRKQYHMWFCHHIGQWVVCDKINDMAAHDCQSAKMIPSNYIGIINNEDASIVMFDNTKLKAADPEFFEKLEGILESVSTSAIMSVDSVFHSNG